MTGRHLGPNNDTTNAIILFSSCQCLCTQHLLMYTVNTFMRKVRINYSLTFHNINSALRFHHLHLRTRIVHLLGHWAQAGCIVYFNRNSVSTSFVGTLGPVHLLLGPLGPQIVLSTSIEILSQLHLYVDLTGPTDSICYFKQFQILSQLHLLGPLGPQTPFVTPIVFSNFISTSFVGTLGPQIVLSK